MMSLWPHTVLSPSMCAGLQYKFAVMGALDSVAGIMQVLAVNYISNGSLVTLLMQAAVPVCCVAVTIAVLNDRPTD